MFKQNKILIIEDDETLNRNICQDLKNNNYVVVSAGDGLLGEKLLMENKYECIILDINLPYTNGYELCRKLREYDLHTPVLMLTAFDEVDDKIQGFDAGADDYLTKPFFTKELLARVNSLIKRSSGNWRQRDSITIGDISLNPESQALIREGKKIILTPREYFILLKLMQAGGEPVSKQELIRDIWGSVYSTNYNTLGVYINFLRNKIDKPFTKHILRTKVGLGYYLDV